MSLVAFPFSSNGPCLYSWGVKYKIHLSSVWCYFVSIWFQFSLVALVSLFIYFLVGGGGY